MKISWSAILLACLVAYQVKTSFVLRTAFFNVSDSDPDLDLKTALFGAFAKLVTAFQTPFYLIERTDFAGMGKTREAIRTYRTGLDRMASAVTIACVRNETCVQEEIILRAADDGRGIRVLKIRAVENVEPEFFAIFFHGGGTTFGEADFPAAFAMASRTKAVVISVDYRLAPENPYPAAVNDGYEVLQWAVELAHSMVTNPRKFVLAGDSAGALIASGLAQRWRDENRSPRIHKLILTVPMLGPILSRSYSKFADIHGLPFPALAFFWDCYAPNVYECVVDPVCSPVSASVERLRGVAEKVIIVSAKADAFIDEAREYARKLKLAGVKVKVVERRGAHIGFAMFDKYFLSGEMYEDW